jgi:hypothetical protein
MKRFLLSTAIIVFFIALSSDLKAQRRTYPTGITLNGVNSYCQWQTSTALTIPTMPTTQCGSSGANANVTHTTTIFSNTVNATTGGTAVATLSNNNFGTNASYIPPTNTCGTIYYYAVVSWNTDECASAGSLTSNIVAVNISCSCLAPSTNTSVTTCGTTWYDSGGASGNYANNQDYSVTFCPENPDQAIRVQFTSLSTQGAGNSCTDCIYVFMADNSSGTADDIIGGTTLPPPIVSTSPNGCITFRFVSDGSTVSSGWAANVTCVIGCQSPIAAFTSPSPLTVCPSSADSPGNPTITFDASSSSLGAYSSGGFSLSQYRWDFGDGTLQNTGSAVTTHTYTTPGVYTATLVVADNNTGVVSTGCASTNSASITIRILEAPQITANDASGECNECVDLSVIATPSTAATEVPLGIGDRLDLPDGTGVPLRSSINLDGAFPMGATMTAGCYPTLCLNLEHSWSRDLTIDLIAPNGTRVRVFDRHGLFNCSGATCDNFAMFGLCANADNNNNPILPGCPAEYCIVNSGGNSWTNYNAVTQAAPSTNGQCAEYSGACRAGNGRYYIPGTYNSTNSFAAFNGVPLNGTWTIEILDNQTVDNGILFGGH